jgi:hypothetical protein
MAAANSGSVGRGKTNNEQQLIDIMFQVALTMKNNPWFLDKSKEEVAEWLQGQLKECGFETEARGASWAVLINHPK